MTRFVRCAGPGAAGEGTNVELSAPRQLFPLEDRLYSAGSTLLYDINSDGQRFMMVEQADESSQRRIHVVLNWFEELKQRLPTGARRSGRGRNRTCDFRRV